VLPGEAPRGRAARNPPRALRRLLPGVLATIASAALLAAGCGDDGEDAPASRSTELTISLDPDGRGGERPQKGLVRCGDGAPVPGARACRVVANLPSGAAAPVPPGTACTQIYGGPDVVRIEGVLEGERVDAELSRANGCEIERFGRWLPLLRELFPGYRPGAGISP
jgi:hypothetical protein